MEYASVTVQVSKEDLFAFFRLLEKGRRQEWLVALPLGLAFGAFAVSFFLEPQGAPSNPSSSLLQLSLIFFGVTFIFLLISFFVQRWVRSERFLKKNNPSAFHLSLYQVLDEGLYLENDRGQGLTRWTAIGRVVESGKHFYIIDKRFRRLFFPKRTSKK